MKIKGKKVLSTFLCFAIMITMAIPGMLAFAADITLDITLDGISVTETQSVTEYGNIQLGYTLSAEMPEGASVEWTSNLPLLAGVDNNGKVTGYDYSKAAVFRLWLDEEVRTIPVVGESTADAILKAIESAGIDLETADTATIVNIIRVTAGDALADSLQKALDNMNVEITATLYDSEGNKLASDTISVLVEKSIVASALPTGIHITNKRVVPKTVAVGKTIELYGAYTPVRAALTSDFKWTSSDTSVATVDENGVVTFVGIGTVTIELGFSSVGLFAYKDNVTFAVWSRSELPVTDFTITGETSVAEGETTQLSIDNLNPPGAYTGDIVWSSSDPTVAIVDQNGMVTGLDGGSGLTYSKSVTISATIGTIARTTEVKVTRSVVGSTISGVEISGETASGIGNAVEYTATVTPSRLSGNKDVTFNWGLINPVTNEKIFATADTPANDGISTMTSNGVLTGLADGTSTVFIDATYNGTTVTDTLAVTIGTAITDFVINGTATINEGDSTQLTISGVTPSDAVYEKVVWSSANPGIASVDENGVVKGLDAGGNYSFINNPSQSATINATINGVSRSFTVTVKAKLGLNAYTGGYINGPDTVVADIPYTYTSTHTPVRMDVYKQTWGVDSSISSTENEYVSVDTSTGAVTGKMAGTTEIFTLMQNNIIGSSKQTLSKAINVVELVPKSITITNPTKYDYLEGETELDLTGLTVKITYDKNEVAQYYPEAINWTDEQLTAVVTDYEVGEINTALLDNEQYIVVTVTRAGKSLRAIFPILVSSKKVDTIEVTQAPQYQYIEGDTELNLDGLKIKANYLNADSEEITGYNVNTSDFDPTLFNVEQNITVSYTHAGRTADTTFPVIIYGIPVVTVTTTPPNYSGEWTNDDVTFTLDSTNQIDGITYYYKTASNSEWQALSSNTITVDTSIEETYYFKAVNGKEIESTETVGYLVNIDKVVPVFALVPEETELTNESYNVDIQLGDIGASGIKKITLDGKDITGQTSFAVDNNSTYTVVIETNSGLVSTQEITISNIDKEKPQINNVTVSEIYPGDYSGNEFFFKGDVGVSISAVDFGVAGIDHIEYRFLDENGESIGDWATYDETDTPMVSSQFKGYVEARAIDNAGNISDAYCSKMFVVDIVKPTDVVITATDDSGEYISDSWTASSVEISLSSTAFSDIYMYYYSTDGGNSWTELQNGKLTAFAHGIVNYQFKAKSYSGLESDITAFTVKIDKIVPVIRVDFEGAFGRWTSDTVEFSFSMLNETISGVTYYYSTDGQNWVEITTGNQIILNDNTNATYTFKAVNGAGIESTPSDSYKVMIDTVVPTIVLNPETTEFTKAPFDILYTATCGNAGLKSVKVNGVDVTGEDKYTVNGNGTYVFVVTGNNGLSCTEVIIIDNFDYDAPAIASIDLGEYVKVIDGIKLYNKDTVITINTSNNGGSEICCVKYRLLDEEMNAVTEWLEYDESNRPVVNASFKGYVEACVEDIAGNTSNGVSELFMVDDTIPEFELNASTTEPTNENVTITFNMTSTNACGVANVTVNGEVFNGTELVVTENGTYNFTVTLNNGNSTTKMITVDNIDKTTPVITMISTGNYATMLNGVAVYGDLPTLTIGASDNVTVSKIEYQLSDGAWIEYNVDSKPIVPNNFNGTIKIRAIDTAGNISEVVETNEILVDTATPDFTISASTTEPTNADVIIAFNFTKVGACGVKSVTLNGEVFDGTEYVATENGTYTFTVTLNNGKSATKSITVNNIDKAVPTITSIVLGNCTSFVDETRIYDSTVTVVVTANDYGNSDINKVEYRYLDENGNPIGEWTEYNAERKPTVESQFKGYVEAKVTDNAGNASSIITSALFVVDDTTPEFDLSVSTTELTNESVIIAFNITEKGVCGVKNITVNGKEFSDTELVVDENGTYTFTVALNNGKSVTKSIDVSNIDKIAPEITGVSTGKYVTMMGSVVIYDASPELTITASDNMGVSRIEYQIGNGEWLAYNTDSKPIIPNKFNGTVKVRAFDTAGNISSVVESITILVDNTTPEFDLSADITTPVNDDVKITLNIIDSGICGVAGVMVNGKVLDGDKYVVTENGTYNFTVVLNNGRSTTKSITISNIDKDAPKITSVELGDYIKVVDGVKLFDDVATVTITTIDYGTSNIEKIEYRFLDENENAVGEWITYNDSNKPIVNSQFKGYVEARVTDTAGNVSSTLVSELFMVDNTTPEFELSASTEWTSESVVISLNITNSGICGVAGVTVNGESLNGTEYVANENGIYRFTVTLNNGKNVTKSITVSNVDKTVPVITDISTGDYTTKLNGTEIYGTLPMLTITADDNVAISKIEYQLDGEWLEYNADNKPTIPNDFNGKIKARAVDTAGNISAVVESNMILVDTDMPTLSVDVKSEEVWDEVTATFTLSGKADSGIAYYMAKTEDGYWVVLDDTTFTISGNESQTCYFKVVSNAGIESEVVIRTTDSSIASFTIQEPSQTTIRCKDGIILHTSIVGNVPEGAYVEWTASNNNFNVEETENNTLTIISQNNGYTTFTATLYDADGNILAVDTIEMCSKAGFGDKIGGFFRSLFGTTKLYDK